MKFSTVAANVAGTVPIIGTVVGACRIAQQCVKNTEEKKDKFLKITQGCFEMIPVLGPAIFWTERLGFLASKKFFKLADGLHPTRRKILLEAAAVASNIAGATPVVGSFVGVIRCCLAGNYIGSEKKRNRKRMQGIAEVVPLIGPAVFWTARVAQLALKGIEICVTRRRKQQAQRLRNELERSKNPKYDQQVILYYQGDYDKAYRLQQKSGGRLIELRRYANINIDLQNLTHNSRLYIVGNFNYQENLITKGGDSEMISNLILRNVSENIKGVQSQERRLKISLVGNETALAYGDHSFMHKLGEQLVKGKLSCVIAGRAPMNKETANQYPADIRPHLHLQPTSYRPTAEERGLPTLDNEVPYWRKTHHLVKTFHQNNKELPDPYPLIKPTMEFHVEEHKNTIKSAKAT